MADNLNKFFRLLVVIVFHHVSASCFAGSNFLFTLEQLDSVSASGWISDGTKGTVDMVEIEATGTKKAAQEIGRLYNAVTKRILNGQPDFRRIMSGYTLKMEFHTPKESIFMAIITAKILCVTRNGEAMYFELDDGFSSESFVTKLESVFFGRKEGFWTRMSEKTRHKNEF